MEIRAFRHLLNISKNEILGQDKKLVLEKKIKKGEKKKKMETNKLQFNYETPEPVDVYEWKKSSDEILLEPFYILSVSIQKNNSRSLYADKEQVVYKCVSLDGENKFKFSFARTPLRDDQLIKLNNVFVKNKVVKAKVVSVYDEKNITQVKFRYLDFF